jgi:hypothetical protein
MHRYLVIDINTEDGSIAFVDRAGKYHVGRWTAEAPIVGDDLDGMPPQLGSALLKGRYGRTFAVIFDLVNVTQGDAFDRLHASLTP